MHAIYHFSQLLTLCRPSLSIFRNNNYQKLFFFYSALYILLSLYFASFHSFPIFGFHSFCPLTFFGHYSLYSTNFHCFLLPYLCRSHRPARAGEASPLKK